ncbi:MAG TPA: sodium:solute symporter [Blastocatellia bacterium]|nr:sodium:solute symporter [Blastocatellia bacterium]
MQTLDLVILLAYLVGTMLFGAYFSRAQKDVKTYFVGSQRVPWWAIMASIVSTETSSVTFVSVPGVAFTGNYTFLQWVMGYQIGRIMISVLFVPLYFRGELLTVYQLLGRRFGDGVRRLVSSIFLVSRSLSDGFRLYLTGLVLSAVLLAMPGVTESAGAWFPSLQPRVTIVLFSVVIMGVATTVYSYLGGMSAVIWTDVSQLAIYLIGAITAATILFQQIPGGWSEIFQAGMAAGKFNLFDFTWTLTKSYTFWSGLIGGAFFTTASHGTDQLMVQRYLCSDSPRHAQRALLVSGAVVFVQFVLFLMIGTMLWVFYNFHAAEQMGAFTVNGRVQVDSIFPQFIITHLPTGLMGLVIAAIAAAAFTSSLNAQAATTVADFYLPLTKGRRSEAHYLNVSKWLTAFWGLTQLIVGIVAVKLSRRVVDEVLGIASFTNGVILGVFFLGRLTTTVSQGAAFVGIIVGASVIITIRLLTSVSWQWYVLVGSLVTFISGYLTSLILRRRTTAAPVEVVSE